MAFSRPRSGLILPGRSNKQRAEDAALFGDLQELLPLNLCEDISMTYFARTVTDAFSVSDEVIVELASMAKEEVCLETEDELRARIKQEISKDVSPETIKIEALHARESYIRHWLRVLDYSSRKNEAPIVQLDDVMTPIQVDKELLNESLETLTANTTISRDDIFQLQAALATNAKRLVPLKLPRELRIERSNKSYWLHRASAAA